MIMVLEKIYLYGKNHPLLSVIILIIILFRILLPLRIGQFGPDEAFFALRANQFFRCTINPAQMVTNTIQKQVLNNLIQPCFQLPSRGLVGRLGFFYGPYISSVLLMLYGITHFLFPLLFVLTGIVFAVLPFLLAVSLKNSKEHFSQTSLFWVFILGITSPLTITYSLVPLWDTPYLLLFSTLIICTFLSHLKWKIKDVLIGTLLGISLASHIQALPMVLGWVVYYFIRQGFGEKKRIFLILTSIIIPLLPYLLTLFLARNSLVPRLRIIGQEQTVPNIVLSISGIYRFFGMDYPFSTSIWKPIIPLAIILVWITLSILLLFFFFTLFYLWNRRGSNRKNSLIKFIGITSIIYLFFSFFTNMADHPQEYMMTWWFVPVLAPFILFFLFPKKIAHVILGILVAINILTIGIQTLPRIISGTETSYPNGPSWWMIENIAYKLCQETGGKSTNVFISRSPPEDSYVTYSLVSMISIQHSNCTAFIRFVDRREDAKIWIIPDRDTHRFTILKFPQP